MVEAILFMHLLLFAKVLTERDGENDRKREETVAVTAPIEGSPGRRPGEGANGLDATADPERRYSGEGLFR